MTQHIARCMLEISLKRPSAIVARRREVVKALASRCFRTCHIVSTLLPPLRISSLTFRNKGKADVETKQHCQSLSHYFSSVVRSSPPCYLGYQNITPVHLSFVYSIKQKHAVQPSATTQRYAPVWNKEPGVSPALAPSTGH